MWYSNSRLLSYNALFNFVMSPRGNGKTFDAKRWAVNDFIKRGNKFIYVRRYKTEFKKKEKFFDDIKQNFPNHEFKVYGWSAYIDGEVAGYFIPLSTSQIEKSTAYPDVNKILFDEFVIDKGKLRYLKDEVETFLDLFETVDRKRDTTRALFMANKVSVVNPYFSYWGIRIRDGERFTLAKDGLLAVEMFTDEEFIEAKEKTRFGKLVSGTRYGDYAIHNKSLRDDKNFILEKKPKKAVYLYSFIIDNKEYAVWNCKNEGFIYFNKQADPTHPIKFVMTKEDHSPNYLLIATARKRMEFKYLMTAFEMGQLMFNDNETKNAIYDILALIK